MKRQIARFLLLAFFLFLPACALPLPGTLRICIDGAAYQDVSGLIADFQEEYPQIQVEVEVLPEVKLTLDERFLPVLDADSVASRAAALEQNRAALLAGNAGFGLYLVTGGTSQFSPMNGGALVEDPYALMASGGLEDLSGLGCRPGSDPGTVRSVRTGTADGSGGPDNPGRCRQSAAVGRIQRRRDGCPGRDGLSACSQ